MTTQATPLTNVSKSDAKEVKYYLIDGVRYATPSNWQRMGLQPKDKAVKTHMTTRNGFEFDIFAESETTKYDAKKAEAEKEARKEQKKMETELFKLYMKREISREDYLKGLDELSK